MPTGCSAWTCHVTSGGPGAEQGIEGPRAASYANESAAEGLAALILAEMGGRGERGGAANGPYYA
jgi:hypothetical protein